MNYFSTPNIEDSYARKCRALLMENTHLDLVMVTDRYANIVAKATRQNPQSSIRQLSAEEIVKTALRTTIAKGAFDVSKNTTGRTSNIHVQYNAMDIIMYPLETDITLIAIGMVDSGAIPEIYSSVARYFPMNLKKAIVVDDEDDIRNSIGEVLRRRGFEVESAESGPACIKVIENAKHNGIEYGIVMMDIRMPGMDGFEAYKSIHLISPNTKVIFITAFEYTEEEVARKVQNCNVKVLRKPFTRADLLQIITDETNTPARD